ncbi:MAG: hypothetical protein JSW27_16735 [Phycisphaerales bacterium]|nr:MAG: hypothetical protein JSW27_16735 [Phycisphaerales bacterium]
MKRQMVMYSTVASLLFWAPLCPCLSQTRQPRVRPRPSQVRDMQRRSEQRRLESQKRAEEFARIRAEYTAEASQEALGADAEQWKRIESKMRRIEELRVQPSLNFSIYGSAGGRSESSTHSSQSGPLPSSGRSRMRYGSGSGSAGGTAGGMGQSGASVRYGASGGAAGSAGGGSYGFSSGGSSGSSYGYGFGPRVGPNGERPIKKQVGALSLGWTWPRPSEDKKPDELTDGDKMCEQLLDALTAETPEPELVQQRVEQLRRCRQEQLRQLRRTQQELRALVTGEQEAKLILMGYLDFSWDVSTGSDTIR